MGAGRRPGRRGAKRRRCEARSAESPCRRERSLGPSEARSERPLRSAPGKFLAPLNYSADVDYCFRFAAAPADCGCGRPTLWRGTSRSRQTRPFANRPVNKGGKGFSTLEINSAGRLPVNDVTISEEKCSSTDLPTTDSIHFWSVGVLEGGFPSVPTRSGRWPTCEG